MKTKNYQDRVLSDLRDYTEKVVETGSPSAAFREYWKGRPVPTEENDRFLRYNDSIPGVPRVTAKVPTAGGKTFIACNALREIIENYIPSMDPKVIVWFVPSEAILSQTYRNLSDPTHPYRHVINSHFNGAVQVYDKESLLLGRSFSPEQLGSQLSIFVLEIQSFASRSKDLRSYKDNENLYAFVDSLKGGVDVASADESSLVRVIANLHPIVIVDESHNFQGQLRIETLSMIKPKFIYELTATPKESSNVISYITAQELKAEHMVKLPVIVSNRKNSDDVLYAAYNLRRHLEKVAMKEDDYIRPIVLFQAEPRSEKDTVTFYKLKQKLLDMGINEGEIAIKVSGKDELKGVDLMDENCKIRYIITVNALKEGWDCPFAYILASIADRNSRIDVEQILGRTLRLPYAKPRKSKELGMAYVLTSSNKFSDTLQSIVKAMNTSGFDRKDVREQDLSEPDEVKPEKPGSSMLPLEVLGEGPVVPSVSSPSVAVTTEEVIDGMDAAKIVEKLGDERHCEEVVDEIISNALDQNEEYETAVSAAQENSNNGMMSVKANNVFDIRKVFRQVARDLRLPEFYVKGKVKSIFGDDESFKLTFSYLLKDLDLTMCDKNMKFKENVYEVKQIDVNSEGVAKIGDIDRTSLIQLNEYFKGLSNEGKKRELTERLVKKLKKYDAIEDGSLRKYISDVLSTMTEDELIVREEGFEDTRKVFAEKLDALCSEYALKKFIEMMDSNRIFLDCTYQFPDRIVVDEPIRGLDGGLYLEEENDMDTLEMKVITEIAQLDNVLFWHRNGVRGDAFGISGFIPNNHYPDFIVAFQSGVVAAVETKGDVYDNSDSTNKLKLGTFWSNMSDSSKFKYFMVFEGNGIEGAKTVNELMNILRNL